MNVNKLKNLNKLKLKTNVCANKLKNEKSLKTLNNAKKNKMLNKLESLINKSGTKNVNRMKIGLW